jgi:type II secretory pathway component PulC
MKIKIFKKENNFKNKDLNFNLNLYWEIAICSTLILVALSSFFAYNLFQQMKQKFVLPTTAESGQVPTISQDRINEVLNYFSDKEKKSTQILNSPAPVVDPSL